MHVNQLPLDPHIYVLKKALVLFNSVSISLSLLFLVAYFACWLPHPEDKSCVPKLSSAIENHHIFFYMEKIRPAQEKLKSNMETVVSDISYLAQLNRKNDAIKLRDSIWKTFSFDPSRMIETFEERNQLETEVRKNTMELKERISDKDDPLNNLVSISNQAVQNLNKIHSVMYLYLRGHRDSIPLLNQMATRLVQSVLEFQDQEDYDRLNREYNGVIQRAQNDLKAIVDMIEPIKTDIDVALTTINSAMKNANKQTRSGEHQQTLGKTVGGIGAGMFTVAGVQGMQLAITSAAMVANPVLLFGVMLGGGVVGAIGAGIMRNGDEIVINAEDLVKNLKAMKASFDKVTTLINDHQNALLNMQGSWNAQTIFVQSIKNSVDSHLKTRLNSFSENDKNDIQTNLHRIIKENRNICQLIEKTLHIIPTNNQITQEEIDQ